MSYEYDVFVSYAHDGQWQRWTSRIFLPLLQHWLNEELGRPAAIFHDEFIDVGTEWSSTLRDVLSRSRVLLPLLSRRYFASPACRAELASMLARQDAYGVGPVAQRRGFIVPAIIHGGEFLDDIGRLRDIQAIDLRQWGNVWLNQAGPKYEQLSEALRDELAPAIAAAIRRAPPYDERWGNLDLRPYIKALGAPPPSLQLPKLS